VLDIVCALEETEEWGEEWGAQVLDVIQAFDKTENKEPCKQARMIVAPSCVPVLGSVTNTPSKRQHR